MTQKLPIPNLTTLTDEDFMLVYGLVLNELRRRQFKTTPVDAEKG